MPVQYPTVYGTRPRTTDLRGLLRIARRRWVTILLVLLATVGAAVVVTLRTSPTYQSEVRLFASTPITDSTQAYQGGLFSEQRVASYADLIDSRPVITEVQQLLGRTSAGSSLSDSLSAEAVPGTVIMTMTAEGGTPAEAQRIANTTARVFIDFVNELEDPASPTASAPVRLALVDPASRPSAPVSPQPLRDIPIAVVLGLILGLGAALVRDLLDNTVTTGAQIQALTGAPLVGSIPHVGAAARDPLVKDDDSHSVRAEAFRIVRTNLRYIGVGNRARVFVVTSSVPGEAKTTTALNLAIMMARAGQRVALVEGDLRRPRVNQYLGLEPSVGLTTVLVGSLDLAQATQQPFPDLSLHVLTSGNIPPNPAELLQSDEMAAVLTKLREDFEMVIIDAPPLIPVTDSALLAAMGDATVVVVRHGKTTTEQLRHSAQRLENVDARLGGAILTMVPQSRSKGYGYAGYPSYESSSDEVQARV
ncbi:MAG TPA: polysaccharide biosynthesis tyrosine autokinase [Nocardioidaceae bacterium]|nr:polysaccharide biosynthesis tyrosine autokinase [Nocardioidaceae bacterium]